MNNLATVATSRTKKNVPAKPFLWKTQRDEFLRPSEMRTRHLFFTLRMIWNHSMPEEAKLYPFREYDFGPYYTNTYMQKAVRALGRELASRDVPVEYAVELKKMLDYLAAQKTKLPEHKSDE